MLLVMVALVAVIDDGGATAKPAAATRPFAYRYLFSSSHVAKTAVAYGWNLIDVSGKSEADALPRGTRALLWVGDWSNDSCTWQISDADLTRQVRATANDKHVAGYYYSDEPDPVACPDAPAQHMARSKLIRGLAPAKFTVMVASSNSDSSPAELPLWRGAATFVGIDPYPCYRAKPCDFGDVTRMIRAADRAHIRYWGVLQAFGDDGWRWPTASELTTLTGIWGRSHAEGSMTFSWTWDGQSLAGKPNLLRVLREFNRGG
jgi:hypothetical protein